MSLFPGYGRFPDAGKDEASEWSRNDPIRTAY